jgi:predicted dinucleotide-utilizing enzyme
MESGPPGTTRWPFVFAEAKLCFPRGGIAPLSLRSSGAAAERTRPRTPQVYVDGNLFGGLDVLRSILAENVEEVKYMGPTEAALEFGPEAGGGAILVKLHKQPKS